MISWKFHHRAETASTNQDARGGVHGDVYTADYQTAGRGRLSHRWLSAPRRNLMMSVVLSVEKLSIEQAATLPIVAGLSVAEALESLAGTAFSLKWPNDVWAADGRKIAGILCERMDEAVIVGIGVNVSERNFADEIAAQATSLALLGATVSVVETRDVVLAAIARNYDIWCCDGLAALLPRIVVRDALKGRFVSISQADEDPNPQSGICGGICANGALDVGGVPIFAGEAHVCAIK